MADGLDDDLNRAALRRVMNLNAKAVQDDDPITTLTLAFVGSAFTFLAQWADVAWSRTLMGELHTVVVEHDHATCTEASPCGLGDRFREKLAEHFEDEDDVLDLDVLIRPAMQIMPLMKTDDFLTLLDQVAQAGGLR